MRATIAACRVACHPLAALAASLLVLASMSAWSGPVDFTHPTWREPADGRPVAVQISERVSRGFEATRSSEAASTLAVLEPVYVEREYAPIWVGEDGLMPRGRALLEAIRRLDEDGLNPGDYGVDAMDALASESQPGPLAELEVRLSLALVQSASDLASGRLEPQRVNPKAYVYPQDVDRTEVLRTGVSQPDIAAFLASFQPAQDNYRRLKQGLARYREIAAHGGWIQVPEGPTLDPGATDPRVGALRTRLRQSGDLTEENDAAESGGNPDTADDALVDAVRRFQYRHGREPDGRVGRDTLAALNVPVQTRVDQMLLNMERRRWMPDRFEKRYIFVNLADFYLKVVDTIGGRERTIFTTHVVVGKPYHQTPEFSNAVKYIELNPYWNVPPSIARNELLPKIKANPDYLRKNDFELFSGWDGSASRVDPATVDWDNVTRSGFRFKIRQGPGPNNALGRVKFMFPNPHNVYLHDTPAQALFKSSRRAFSHGCIRVEQPTELAVTLLQWQGDWPRERIVETIGDGARTVIPLAEPVPVHLAYVSAWVNKDGSVHFRDDVYGKDEVLARVLLGRELGSRPEADGVLRASAPDARREPASPPRTLGMYR